MIGSNDALRQAGGLRPYLSELEYDVGGMYVSTRSCRTSIEAAVVVEAAGLVACSPREASVLVSQAVACGGVSGSRGSRMRGKSVRDRNGNRG